MKNVKILALLLMGTLIYGCKDDDDDSVPPNTPINPNQEELITTVRLTFVDTNSIASSFEFNDPDGEGGNPPLIDTLELNLGMFYQVNTTFLDASDPTNIEDITLEIKEEDDEHLICYDTTALSGLTINRIDTDGTYEVGLETTWDIAVSAASNNGIVTLTLKHQPGVKNGLCAPGDTDVEVNFPVKLQ